MLSLIYGGENIGRRIKMTIGERIKNRRIELGYTVDQLADMLGKNRATIYRYENGDIKEMPTPILEPLAKALRTTPADLMGWSTNMNDVSNNHSITRIPVVRRVAAGIPIDSIEEVIGWEEMPSHKVHDGSYFGLIIQGHSMEPGIADGDTVIVREQPDAEDGQIVVALVNGNDGCCKRLKKYENGIIALMSDNPAYPPMYFNVSDVENTPVVIRGVVKELHRSF